MLCDGFRRAATEADHGGSTIPGIFSRFPNYNVAALRTRPWPQILALLGQSGEKVMLDLLLDSSIFVAVDAGYGNYFQLTGKTTTLPRTQANIIS
jgi:telomerase reverse transcriptase